MEKDRKTAIALGVTAGAIALGIAISAIACANTMNKNNGESAAPMIGTPHIITTSIEEPTSSESEEEIVSSEDSEYTTSSEEENTESTSESSEEPQPEDPIEPEPEEPQPEEPADPEPETPEEPEEPEPEEPEITVPSIDPNMVYNFYTIKDLLINNPELNNSYCTMQVRVAGTALGVPGFCFFQDLEDSPIERGSQITQTRMANLLAREDIGNNNASYNRGDIITISGVVAYEKVTYLGVTCVTIK